MTDPDMGGAMDYNLIKRIVALVERSDIHELEVESGGVRIKVNKNTPVQIPQVVSQMVQDVGPAVHMAPTPTLPTSQKDDHQLLAGQEGLIGEERSQRDMITIDSPMVGTFYRASSPESPPFIKVGDRVEQDSVVCILEAMKVMNELKAEVGGRITEILVENAQPVEFGQALFRVDPR